MRLVLAVVAFTLARAQGNRVLATSLASNITTESTCLEVGGKWQTIATTGKYVCCPQTAVATSTIVTMACTPFTEGMYFDISGGFSGGYAFEAGFNYIGNGSLFDPATHWELDFFTGYGGFTWSDGSVVLTRGFFAFDNGAYSSGRDFIDALEPLVGRSLVAALWLYTSISITRGSDCPFTLESVYAAKFSGSPVDIEFTPTDENGVTGPTYTVPLTNGAGVPQRIDLSGLGLMTSLTIYSSSPDQVWLQAFQAQSSTPDCTNCQAAPEGFYRIDRNTCGQCPPGVVTITDGSGTTVNAADHSLTSQPNAPGVAWCYPDGYCNADSLWYRQCASYVSSSCTPGVDCPAACTPGVDCPCAYDRANFPCLHPDDDDDVLDVTLMDSSGKTIFSQSGKCISNSDPRYHPTTERRLRRAGRRMLKLDNRLLM